MKTLDEVKAEIEPILKHQKGQQIAQKQAEDLLKQARAAGSGRRRGGTAHPGDQLRISFARKDILPGLGPATQFMDAVFSEAEKSPPDVAPSSQGVVVFQLLAVKPASTPTFEEIRTKIEEEFKNERSSVLLSQKIQELSDRAKAEHDLKRAAKELGATVKTSDFVLPDGQVPDVGSMSGQASVAFNMKPGEISGPINSGTDAVVLAVLENQQPTDADFAAKRDQIRDQLLLQKQQERFALFVSSLVDEMTRSGKIKSNEEEIKAIESQRQRAGNVAAVTCPFRAPQAFCCIPRRCLRAAASVILGQPLISLSTFSPPPARACGRFCRWGRSATATLLTLRHPPSPEIRC